RRLDFVEAEVEADFFVKIFVLAPVIAKHRHLPGDLWITGRDRPAVAVHGEILRWIKAERRVLGEAAGALAAPLGAMRLGAIFDNPQAMFAGKFLERVDVRGATIQMYRQNADGAFGDALARIFRIDGVGVVDVAENRLGAGVDHRLDAGKRRERRHENLIAGLQALGEMQQMYRRRPA